MAIIKRTDADITQASGGPDGSIAMDEAPASPATDSPSAAPAEGMRSMTESLPAALEPELRRIIDTAVARVAAIELEAIRDARALTQRSEEEARQALAFALDRAFNLINTLELLAATVGGMAEALKIELDDAIDALRNVPQPESELAKELKQRKEASAQQALPVEAPAPEAPPVPEPAPPTDPAPAAAEQPEPEPAPAVQPEPAPAVQPEPAPAVQAQPEAVKPEPVEPDAVQAQEPQTARVEQDPEQVAAAVSRGNGYPPAERQAESLAAAGHAEQPAAPQPQPQRTVMRGPAPGDGRPTRRRGLMRRLFG